MEADEDGVGAAGGAGEGAGDGGSGGFTFGAGDEVGGGEAVCGRPVVVRSSVPGASR